MDYTNHIIGRSRLKQPKDMLAQSGGCFLIYLFVLCELSLLLIYLAIVDSGGSLRSTIAIVLLVILITLPIAGAFCWRYRQARGWHENHDVEISSLPYKARAVFNLQRVTFLEDRLQINFSLFIPRQEIEYLKIKGVDVIRWGTFPGHYGIRVAESHYSYHRVGQEPPVIGLDGFDKREWVVFLRLLAMHAPQATFNDLAIQFRSGEIPIL